MCFGRQVSAFLLNCLLPRSCNLTLYQYAMINGQDPFFMFRNLVLYLKEMNKLVKDSIMPEKLNTDESLNNFWVIVFFFQISKWSKCYFDK